jgi:hypothetical protein
MGTAKAIAELFEGRHFDRKVIILGVRWYLRFKLSLRDSVEMMAERGLSMAPTIMLWVQRLDGPMLTPPKHTLSILLMSRSAPCDLAKAS